MFTNLLTFDELLTDLWQQYQIITPQARKIYALFSEKGDIQNDHIAFRTFADSPVDLEACEQSIVAYGFEPFDDYVFEEKSVRARSYSHPNYVTKIFMSELLWHQFETPVLSVIQGIINSMDSSKAHSLSEGRCWPMPSYEEYQTLSQCSEYAAWVSVWGLRANHFTIYTNTLANMTIDDVVSTLLEHGFSLNNQGGLIKGNESVGLRQASTMADSILVKFSCGAEVSVPSCYYEFAQRYSISDEGLYQGFVASSADKIFESTSQKLH